MYRSRSLTLHCELPPKSRLAVNLLEQVPGGGKGAVFGIGYFNKRDSLGCETMGLGNASTIMP